MAEQKNSLVQIDEQFAKEEHELDEEIAKLKRDQEFLRHGLLSSFLTVPPAVEEEPKSQSEQD